MVPRHSWLKSAGRGGGSLRGVGWGFLVVCVFVARCVHAWCPCWCVCRAFVVAWVWMCLPCVLVCMCVCVGVWLGLAGACRPCGCGCGWCVPWLAPRHSWRRFLSAISRHSWLGFAVGSGGCSSPLLAEGPGCGSLPLLAGVCWWRWCVVACHSWLRVPVAVPRHSWLGGPLVAVLAGPLPLLAEGLGGSSPPLLAGFRRLRRWVFPLVGFPVLCVLVARRVRVVSVLVCVVWCLFVVSVLLMVWARAGLPRVFVCVCVCACVVCWWRAVWCGVVCWWGCGWCVVWLVPHHSWQRFLCATPRHSWLGFAAGGGGRSSPLLAEGLGGGSPPLLAGVRRPQQWVFQRVGVSRVVCACGTACACDACAGVCGVCSWCLCWWWCGRGRAFRVCLCVCVCACVVCWWRAVWCGVVCWWGCGWCVVWLVSRHSWRRFLCATPRHSWLGFGAGGGGLSSPLLAEGLGGGSPPLLAGVRRRSWCAAPRHSWLGPAGCGGVFCGWGCPLLCVFVVCVAVRGGRAVLCVACLLCPRCWCCGVVVRWVCLPRVLVCLVACVWCADGLRFGVPAPFG